MKYLFISTNDTVPWGGSEELWSQAAVRLVQGGHDVSASVWERTPEHPKVAALRRSGVRIHGRYERPIRRNRFTQALATVLQGAPASVRSNELEALGAGKPDLVVFSVGFQWCSKFRRISKALRERGIPYGVVVQLAIEGLPLTDDQTEGFRQAYEGAARVWFVSRQNLELTARELGHRFTNASLVDNPVDLDVHSPPYPDTDRGWRLALVGSLTPHHKGQDLVLEVLARPEWRSRPLHVSFYGSGPCLGTLQRLARINGVENVEFRGFVEEKAQIWAEHHGALFASRMEGRSLALQEAMAHGRLVISTDVGGAHDLITHGRSGYIAPAITVDGIAHVLEEAWAAREHWRMMGEAARVSVRGAVRADPVGRFAQAVAQAAAEK